jgi:hypothetical protein
METYQALHGEHLLGYPTKGDIPLQLKTLVVDDIDHGLEGVAFEVPSEFCQPPSNGPVGPLRLYFGLTLRTQSPRSLGSI